MKQMEYTQAEMQLYITLHNQYKANTDKRIADLLKENDNLRQTIREKDERINELTDTLLDKDKAKCKVVSLRPAYAR